MDMDCWNDRFMAIRSQGFDQMMKHTTCSSTIEWENHLWVIIRLSVQTCQYQQTSNLIISSISMFFIYCNGMSLSGLLWIPRGIQVGVWFPRHQGEAGTMRRDIMALNQEIQYPLVNVYIAIEHGHWNSGFFPIENMVILHSYVSLPEGTKRLFFWDVSIEGAWQQNTTNILRRGRWLIHLSWYCRLVVDTNWFSIPLMSPLYHNRIGHCPAS